MYRQKQTRTLTGYKIEILITAPHTQTSFKTDNMTVSNCDFTVTGVTVSLHLSVVYPHNMATSKNKAICKYFTLSPTS